MTNDSSSINVVHKATRYDLLIVSGIAVFVYIFDLITKLWAFHYLQLRPPIQIIPDVFRFAYGTNTGIAFGMLQGSGVLLNILSPIAFVVLIVVLYKMFAESSMDIWYRLIFGLLIGGALGNIINRLYCGYVIDFIDVFIGTYNWPTFNIADSALTVGEIILISRLVIEEISQYKKNAAAKKQDGSSSI